MAAGLGPQAKLPPPPPQPPLQSVANFGLLAIGDENHLCGASLHASQKIHSRIHHAHGIDYHHDHMHAIGGMELVRWCR